MATAGQAKLKRAALTGDVTASADDNATTIAAGVVTYAKMQDVSATDKVLGRSTAGAGDVEEIACTAAGRALLDDANAAAQRTTLGLGTIATLTGSQSTYTPTLTNVANLTGSTAYACQYLQVGNCVVVSGKVDVDPTTTATSTQLGISLPIASDLATAQECSGVAFAPGIAGQGAAILGDITNNRAQMQWVSSDVTNQAMYFIFMYVVAA